MKINTVELSGLPQQTRIALKRSCGKTLAESGRGLGYFYSISRPPLKPQEEEALFVCLCLACLWEEAERPAVLPFTQCLSQLVKREKLNQSSIDRAVIGLLDMDFAPEHGNLLGIKLFRLCKQIRGARLNSPDFEKLYEDLKWWNHTGHFVQKRWAQEYFTNEQTTKQEEGQANVV